MSQTHMVLAFRLILESPPLRHLNCLGIPSKPPPISPAVLESDTEDSTN
jgi:hypothetical protein